jgi:glycosyltransferase involved in cell wall biosynthesis
VKRLLTIGHSYVVAQNRRLAHEMALAGAGRWSVTAVAPRTYPGDLRPIALEPIVNEASHVLGLDTIGARLPHVMTYRGLRAVLARDWDVVHCWEEPYVAAAAQVARHAPPSARLVVATFQNIAKRYPWPLSRFERQVLQRADAWVAFGESIRDVQSARLARYASLPSRVITPGVDTHAFAPSAALRASARESLGWTDDVPVVGFVGRFVPQKGIATLIAALDRTSSPWRALFVGDGPDRGLIEAFGRTRPDRVRLVTDARHDDVPRWLNAMDVMCAPSRTTPGWREQFGRMLVEAMACGVPVVASRSGEIPHVVGDAGVLVDEADIAQWAAAISRFVSDTAVRADFAARGRARAVEHFAWPVIAARHLDFFEQLTA